MNILNSFQSAADEKLVEWALGYASGASPLPAESLVIELARRLGERLKADQNPAGDRRDHAIRKEWLHIRGGKKLYFMDPKPEDMPVLELIQAVACERRFANQIKANWNVAGHTCLVHDILKSWEVPKYILVQGLLHDLPEGATRDVPSPLSNHPENGFARKVDDNILRALCGRAGVPFPINGLVHKADHAACKLETYLYVPDRHDDWCEWLDAYPDVEGFDPWEYLEDEDESVEMLLERLQEATQGVGSPEFHAEVDSWFAMALRGELP
jgi:hypothetical protein